MLFITGHFGFWELQAMVHAVRAEPVSILARALDNPHLDRLLEDIRQRTGNTVVYRRGTIRRVMRTLQAGHGVAVLIDQHIMSRDAIYVDFFERPAATTSAVAALALRTGAPVVPVFALPLGGGRYRMIYEHPVEPPRADSADAVREFTQRCTDVLEMYVRRHPELWLWMHRRWRDNGLATDSVPGMFPSAERDVGAGVAAGGGGRGGVCGVECGGGRGVGVPNGAKGPGGGGRGVARRGGPVEPRHVPPFLCDRVWPGSSRGLCVLWPFTVGVEFMR